MISIDVDAAAQALLVAAFLTYCVAVLLEGERE